MAAGWSSVSLALRSLLWTILLPGFFAGYLQWRFFGLNRVVWDFGSPTVLLGTACMFAGALLLSTCIVEFATRGRGTLSPVDPPRHLVVRGPYRYVRNPMYVGVMTIGLGEIVLTRSVALAAYWVIWFACVNLFVIGYEEPTLRRMFGASFDEYASQVERWVPRLPRRRDN
jgi:protein-S-isoprenylcysteine O-methyltransferase Ste14